jgi:hypothetical protein
MLSDQFAWVIGLAIIVAGAVSGIRFRGGRSPRSVALYRNPAFPASFRNLPLIWPLVVTGAIPLLILSAPRAFGIQLLSELPRRPQSFLLGVLLAMLFGSLGLILVIGLRVPRRLIPGWLREDDERLQFRPPKPDWFDVILLVVGVIGVIVASALLLSACMLILGIVDF